MPSSDLLTAFLIASAIFACVPGPSMLFAVARTLGDGRRAGWWAMLGFHVAGLCHVAAAAFGVSALIALIPPLFTAMKLVGAGYLIWLGIGYLRRPRPTPRISQGRTGVKGLRDSLLVEILNPKSALFFLAFLPQFTQAGAGLPVWAQIAILGLIVNLMFSLTDALMIEGAHRIARRLRGSARVPILLRRLGGGALIALGINLALTGER